MSAMPGIAHLAQASSMHGVESYRVTRFFHTLYVLKTSIGEASGNGGVNHGDDAGPRVF